MGKSTDCYGVQRVGRGLSGWWQSDLQSTLNHQTGAIDAVGRHALTEPTGPSIADRPTGTHSTQSLVSGREILYIVGQGLRLQAEASHRLRFHAAWHSPYRKHRVTDRFWFHHLSKSKCGLLGDCTSSRPDYGSYPKAGITVRKFH